jgi:hypothetical protein
MRFSWLGYEVAGLLPEHWQEQAVEVANKHAIFVDVPGSSSRPREAREGTPLRRGRVPGKIVADRLPWLFDAYSSMFLELASKFTTEEIVCAKDIRYGVSLNVTIGNDMWFECHVDSNPLEGLLFCTTHPPGSGGELVVANRSDAVGVAGVDADSSRIYPITGQLVFFDARQHAHYVRELSDQHAVRVVAAMNYYTPSCPESVRAMEDSSYLRLL